jgi:hypothetical protein
MIEEILRSRQNWALMNPAREVNDLARDGYRFDYHIGGVTVCTVLSVNMFDLLLAWNSSVALMIGEQKKLVRDWTQNDRTAALSVAMQLLDGMGREGEEPIVEAGEQSITLIKPLTVQEAIIAMNVAEKAPVPGPVVGRMGAASIYDFTNPKTRVGETLYLPTESREIYGRAN